MAPQHSWAQATHLIANSHSLSPKQVLFPMKALIVNAHSWTIFFNSEHSPDGPLQNALIIVRLISIFNHAFSPLPLCRAEVVLGNIIKKKGWRYEAHFN